MRPARSILPLALVVASLAACGDDGDDSTRATNPAPATTAPAPDTTAVPSDTAPATSGPTTREPAATSPAPSAPDEDTPQSTVPQGPWTVEHAMGTTEVAGPVARLVVLDSSFLDASVALGVTPVAATAGLTAGELPGYLAEFVDLATIGDAGMTSNPNLEAIAAFTPDLILCAKVRHEALYEQLAQIAPTACSESSGTNWTEQVLLTGEALGMRAAAEDLLAAFDTRAAEVGEAIGADGMTARIVRFMPNETRVYGAPTFSGSVLTSVGFDVTGDAPLQWHPEYGMAQVSPEQFELLDADVIFATTFADEGSARGDFEAVWGSLPAVAEGRQFDIEDSTWMTGIGVLGANLILDDLEAWLAG